MSGGDLMTHPNYLMIRAANITTSNIVWNRVLSTKGAKYVCMDIKLLDYMHINIGLFPSHTIDQYGLKKHVKIQKAIYGLFHADIGEQSAQRKISPIWVP